MEVIKFQKIEFHANPLPTLTFATELLQGPPKLILFIQNSAAKYEVRSLRLMQRIAVMFGHSFFLSGLSSLTSPLLDLCSLPSTEPNRKKRHIISNPSAPQSLAIDSFELPESSILKDRFSLSHPHEDVDSVFREYRHFM